MTEYYALFVVTPSRLDCNARDPSIRPAVHVLTPGGPRHKRNRMRTADLISQKLTDAFRPESINVVDESHQHAGHAGHRPEGQTHFRVYIVSDAFKGKTRIERHRMINSLLSDELASGVHALAIHAAAPGEGGA